jgi:hypothetical protein
MRRPHSARGNPQLFLASQQHSNSYLFEVSLRLQVGVCNETGPLKVTCRLLEGVGSPPVTIQFQDTNPSPLLEPPLLSYGAPFVEVTNLAIFSALTEADTSTSTHHISTTNETGDGGLRDCIP